MRFIMAHLFERTWKMRLESPAMTNSSKQILESVAQHAARLKARLAETRAAIRRGREDAGEAAGDADGDGDGDEDAGGGKVLPFVRR